MTGSIGGKARMGRKTGGKGWMGGTAIVAVTLVLFFVASGFLTAKAVRLAANRQTALLRRVAQRPDVAKAVSRTDQARPEMQRIPQFDNARATSWKSIIPPHTESTFHRHDRYRSVIAVVGGDLKTVAPDGKTTVTRYETGKSYWFEPMAPGDTHKDVNDTDWTIELIVVELK